MRGGDTHPPTPAKTAAQHPTGLKTGAVYRKFHCRTTLRQSAPTEQGTRVYKRTHRRADPYTNTNVHYRFVNEGTTRKHRRGAAKEQTARTSTTANPAAERPLQGSGGQRGAQGGRANGGGPSPVKAGRPLVYSCAFNFEK